MNVNIQAPFTIKSDQESEIINQIKSLSTYNDRITNAEVLFKVGDGNAADSVIAEIERYMAMPGQALSYKIGQLKIRELRTKAETILSDKLGITLDYKFKKLTL